MIGSNRFSSPRGIFLLALALSTGVANLRADDEATFAALSADIAPALVAIKYVLKAPGTDRTLEREISGVLIDPNGIVLCSNSQFVGARARMALTPTDIKVLVGDDSEGAEATVIARDGEYDLAWLGIKAEAGKKFPAINLEKTGKPEVYQRLFVVDRLGRYFDRAQVVRTGRVAGLAKKPRALIIPDTTLFSMGLPVFDEHGTLVGVTVSQLPDAEEMNNPRAASDMRGAGNVILPAATVAKVTKMALESAPKAPADSQPDAGRKSDDAAATQPAPKP